MEEDGSSSLPTHDITRRLPDSEGGERVEDPAKHWWLPQPGRFGGQLPAGCGEPLLVHFGDGSVVQVTRRLWETQMEGLEWWQLQA